MPSKPGNSFKSNLTRRGDDAPAPTARFATLGLPSSDRTNSVNAVNEMYRSISVSFSISNSAGWESEQLYLFHQSAS